MFYPIMSNTWSGSQIMFLKPVLAMISQHIIPASIFRDMSFLHSNPLCSWGTLLKQAQSLWFIEADIAHHTCLSMKYYTLLCSEYCCATSCQLMVVGHARISWSMLWQRNSLQLSQNCHQQFAEWSIGGHFGSTAARSGSAAQLLLYPLE